MLELNPQLDRSALATEFARTGRVQIRNILTQESARTIQNIVQQQTPWGLVWAAGDEGPTFVKAEQLGQLSQSEAASIQNKIADAVRGDRYALLYSSYPLVAAYLERWNPGSAQEQLLKGINSQSFLDLIREVCAIPEIVKADGQATLYAPGHFLAHHNDSEQERGRRVAYVLNLTVGEWRPEWGGYLNFYDDDFEIIQAMRPRFNSLNLFRVPQVHSVGYVPLFSPIGRYAVTGWARDR